MSEVAHRVWQAMRGLVLDNERRREVCTTLGMSFVRVKALLALAEEPLTMGELAARLSTDRPYTTLIVDDLQQRGLLTRTAHPEDRRAKIVTLTARGRDTAVQAQSLLDEPPPALGALEAEQLAALDGIMAELTPHGAHGSPRGAPASSVGASRRRPAGQAPWRPA
jgi:DNA-binding MarR family transcriptional regulator